LQAIARAGGMCLDQDQTNHLISTHWHDGHLNRNMLAKDIDAVLDTLGFADAAPEGTKFLVAPATAIGPDAPISGEKMALFFALYRASDFATAKEMAREIHAYQGRGHSLGLHSKMMTVRANWPWICRPAALSSIRRIALPLAGHSTMVFLSRCRWVVGHGVEIRLMTI
jgi:hypothetical protein